MTETNFAKRTHTHCDMNLESGNVMLVVPSVEGGEEKLKVMEGTFGLLPLLPISLCCRGGFRGF